ncbi:hypothetical protein [Prauserella muralis]|uniref:hypothetical protein n=1 Tax=Prauserella muralis TaxID=588067 RepID=UPI000DD2C458|nr:hypothetical protein [Prauserella muralis]TWE29328.1 hypothetical protein FHX69_2010 [Prauserella muralis]
MKPDPVTATLDDLAVWSADTGRQSPPDRPHAELMLGLLADELGVTELSQLAEGSLRQLLLEVYPEAADIEPEEVPTVLRTAGDLLDFAADRRLLHAATVENLRTELRESMAPFVTAVADLPEDESDLDDLDDVDEVDLKEVFGLPDRLPPLRLPPEPELAQAARESVLLGQVQQVVLALYGGPDGATDPGDGLDGAEAALLTELSEELGFVEETDEAQIVPTEDARTWPDLDDDEVLLVWQHALSFVLAWSLVLDAAGAGEEDLDFASAGSAFMVLFLTGREGVSLAEWSAMIEETATAELPESQARQRWDAWVAEHGDPGVVLAERLARLGAVTVDDEVVRMTPPAQHMLRSELLDSDVDVPLLPPVEDMTAEDVLEVALTTGPDEAAKEVEAWMSPRTPQAAASELLGAARGGGPDERGAVATLLTPLGAATEQAWREALDEPALRPYAKQALAQLTDSAAELSPQELAWLLADALSDAELRFEPEELAEVVASTVPAGEVAIFDHVWRLDHPNAHEVLTLVGRFHPDKTTAKAARKAAFKVGG